MSRASPVLGLWADFSGFLDAKKPVRNQTGSFAHEAEYRLCGVGRQLRRRTAGGGWRTPDIPKNKKKKIS